MIIDHRPVPRSPDGERYWHMGGGGRLALPFHLRWAIPYVCRQHAWRWRLQSQVSTVVLCALAAWWVALNGYAAGYVIAAPFLVAGLPHVTRIALGMPVLVDAAAMATALGAACVARIWWPAAIPIVILAGCVKETGPVFAATWAWCPWLLLGLAAPAVRMLWPRGSDVLDVHNADVLAHPIRHGLGAHRGHWCDATWMVAPWGLLVAGLYAPTPRLVVALVLAYGLLLIATDVARLYAWAWPALLLSFCATVPSAWLALAVVAHLMLPWKGNGT